MFSFLAHSFFAYKVALDSANYFNNNNNYSNNNNSNLIFSPIKRSFMGFCVCVCVCFFFQIYMTKSEKRVRS